ncbi:MAG: hypothetical protein AVDCRST_MAG68-1112, partial [uncultured Gemmatimonadetes bacterium]
ERNDPAGGGQRRQPGDLPHDPGAFRFRGGIRVGRRRGGAGGARHPPRPDPDGHLHPPHGRPLRHPRPQGGPGHRRHPHRGADRARHAGRPRQGAGRRLRRLPRQARGAAPRDGRGPALDHAGDRRGAAL